MDKMTNNVLARIDAIPVVAHTKPREVGVKVKDKPEMTMRTLRLSFWLFSITINLYY